MEYYFNELEPRAFQRLVNAILVARLGEDARVTPLEGADGGKDLETAPGNPFIVFDVSPTSRRSKNPPPREGRYVFQAKFHRTTDIRSSDARTLVLKDFSEELNYNILAKHPQSRAAFFFLVTNVSASADALRRLDEIRKRMLASRRDIHADIWWKEQLMALLDSLPSIWNAFPQIFAGGKVPALSRLQSEATSDPAIRSLRLAIREQFTRDKVVKFRQIELAKELARLFVDLDIEFEGSQIDLRYAFHFNPRLRLSPLSTPAQFGRRASALTFLLEEQSSIKRTLLEGGPGQGKSTITQMVAQIYRQKILGTGEIASEDRWAEPEITRIPIRIELRQYAEELAKNSGLSIDSYISGVLSSDSGGAPLDVTALHSIAENSPMLLIFDGLDEIGSDELRDSVLDRVNATIDRFEKELHADLRVILTSRPPAIAGRQLKLTGYVRISLSTMSVERVNEYLDRWLSVQLQEVHERNRVRSIFNARRIEPHVDALARNPMQLSVLLHFIYLKDDAFPSRRSDLYDEYFKIVIDRDVEKSPELRKNREIVEALHRFLGFRIHALTEAQQADGSLSRDDLLSNVGLWLHERGDDREKASQLFRLGEERLGLIVILRGEGKHAKYGFEIQPIREYFAAAHINESSSLDAHALFEQMVRRPFWREVALFLAGLRRENEKADLILRARQLDDSPQFGWRQDGRDIVLQLAKEGALSQPRHVLREAIDFVIDLLDPALIPFFNEPRDFIPVVSRLIASDCMEHHKNRLRSLLERASSSNDFSMAWRIFRAASSALPSGEVLEKAFSFALNDVHAAALLRLNLACECGSEYLTATRRASFWEGVPLSIWARQWFKLAERHTRALAIRGPQDLHPLLLERFAFGDFALANPFAASAGGWAVWVLSDLTNRLASIISGQPRSASIAKKTIDSVKLDGLDSSIKVKIGDLVTHLHRLISILPKRVSGEAINRLGSFLAEPGLLSLITARCLYPLLLPHASSLLSDDLRVRVQELFAAPRVLVTSERQLIRPFPTAVRGTHGELIPLVSLVSNYVLFGRLPEFLDLRAIPLASTYVRQVLHKAELINPAVLERLGTLDLRSDIVNYPLKTSVLQKVLAIARRVQEPIILAGCIKAIEGSKFLRLIDLELAKKLLSHERYGGQLARHIMGTQEKIDYIDHIRKIAEEAARHPQSYPLAVVLAAAAFQNETLRTNLPPLASLAGVLRS